MHAMLGLLALVVAATFAITVRAQDDGQWHPELDGSAAGSGNLRWGIDDGSWQRHLDGSWLGRGDLDWQIRRKRDVNPNSLSDPIDEPAVAYAKNAHLRQQYTEAQRNIFGGVPRDLPADTPEVAEAKVAHAVAHENEKLATSDARFASPIHHVTRIATPVATQVSVRAYAPVARVVTPVTHVATPVFGRFVSPVAHIATPAVHVAAPVTHIATVARTVTPLAHVASPVVQAFPPYQYAHSPVVQFYKK